MWIPFGMVSGKKAKPSTAYVQYMQAQAVTINSSGGWSTLLTISGTEKSTFSTGFRRIPTKTFSHSNGILIAASTNTIDDAPDVTDYFVDEGVYLGWDNVAGIGALAGNRMTMARKSTALSGTHPMQFSQSVNKQDSVNWVGGYVPSFGTLDFVGKSDVDPVVASSIVVPIPVGSVAYNDMIIAVAHRVPITIPEGFFYDAVSTVLGTNPNTPLEAKQQTLSIIRKRLTPSDIAAGAFTITATGS